MAERVCRTCGTPEHGAAAFCHVCDTYLGWTVNNDIPTPTAEPPPPPPPPPPPGPSRDQSVDPRPDPPRPDRVLPPVASLKQTEVVVTAGSPGRFELSLKNDSTIVDSYVVDLVEPPAWLALTHSETNLLPATVRTVEVTLAVRPGLLAVAQRATVPLTIRSSVEPSRATPLQIDVVVPRSGPPATLVAQPNLIRLADVTDGGFQLQLDNRAANFGRRYELAATDPEGVVQARFVPPVVDVPAGGVAQAAVRFTAPPPPPGKEISRQLTVTGTDAEGPISVPVTLAQYTSPPPESLPVRLRLEPATISMVDIGTAAVNVVLDNRGGHQQAKFNLSGRDPGGRIGFRFDHTRVAVTAGSLGYVRAVLETQPPARGASETRPFSVVAVADDGREIEAAGTLELSSQPDPIASATLHVHPEHLLTKGRKGSYAVDVDNRPGAEPLHVRLTAVDEYGTARLALQPPVLLVPPGQVARAGLVVEHPRPAGGTTSSRRVQVRATSQTGRVEAEVTFTQQAENLRRLWAVLLVLLGVCVLLPGAVLWLNDPQLDPSTIEGVVRQLVDDAQSQRMPATGNVMTAVAAAFLLLLLLCTALMLLGLTGGGRMVRFAAIVAALSGVGVLVGSGAAVGLPFALVGAVIAFAGGVMLRR